MRLSPRVTAVKGAVCVAVMAALLAAAPAAAVGTGPKDLLLRLADVGAGYVVGDDGGCGASFGREGTPLPLVRLERRHPFRGCGIEFEEAWARPGVRRPAAVESHAYVFRDPAAAAAGLRVGASLLQFTVGPSRRSFVRRAPSRPVGDEAVVLETDDALAGGRARRPGVAVLWRSGRVLAFVFEAGLGGERGETSALGLAERQQARIAVPSPLRPRENNDLEVPLDDPRIAGPVHWLGRSHDPPGPLGRLRLSEVYRDGPGWEAGVRYADKAWLGVWRPRAFARFKRSRFGRLVWHSPCAQATRFTFDEGRAVIYRGYGPPRGDPAPTRPIRLGARHRVRTVPAAATRPGAGSCLPRPGGGDDQHPDLLFLHRQPRARQPLQLARRDEGRDPRPAATNAGRTQPGRIGTLSRRPSDKPFVGLLMLAM